MVRTMAAAQKGINAADEEVARPGNVQVVEFVLGDEHFAIDLFDVKEVVEYTRITKIPNTPSYVKGIIDLRGEITTIIDLKLNMNITEKEEISDENRRIIVLDDTIMRSKIGIMVDDVSSVSTFSPSQVEKTTAAVNSDDTNILGIIRKKSRVRDKEYTELIIWIDIRQILNTTDIANLA
jgi:purine-binding chemotaxis protein CheW